MYGLRVCPSCPDCSESESPCSDCFGSNASPMGGSAGRADAAVGAIEAQKAEGVLHIHMFLYLQNVFQFSTLYEIADNLRQRVLTAEGYKAYIDFTRVASFPDLELFEKEQEDIERAWPAYADDYSLSRPPAFLGPRSLVCEPPSLRRDDTLSGSELMSSAARVGSRELSHSPGV